MYKKKAFKQKSKPRGAEGKLGVGSSVLTDFATLMASCWENAIVLRKLLPMQKRNCVARDLISYINVT